MADTPGATAPRRPVDFWLFWAGQAISALGSSLTAFALPLLVFKLTGSAINLALSWSVIPVSVLIGGALIEWTHDVAIVYGWLGALTFLVVLAFVWTPLGRVGRFMQAPAPAQPTPPGGAALD